MTKRMGRVATATHEVPEEVVLLRERLFRSRLGTEEWATTCRLLRAAVRKHFPNVRRREPMGSRAKGVLGIPRRTHRIVDRAEWTA